MKNIKNIGKKIKIMRNRLNIPQRYIAQELGITQGAYSNIEKTENEISENRLSKIAQIMGVSVEDIEKIEDKIVVNFNNPKFEGANNNNGYINNNFSNPEHHEILLRVSDNLLKTIDLLNKYISKLNS